MAERKPIFLDLTEGEFVEMETTDSITLGGLTMGGNIDMNSAGKITNANAATTDGDVLVYGQSGANLAGLDIDTNPLTMNNQKITGLGTPTASGDATTKAYVDQQVIAGGTVKETLFSADQLDNTDGINALEALYFDAQPAAGDTVTFKNASVTLTMTFVANQGAESAETDVSIETSAATAMQRLVTRTNAAVANTQWDLYYETGTHDDINDPIIDVVEKASAAGDSDSRIYGTWSTQANCQVVEFASGGTVDLDYLNRTSATLPSSDPAEGRFGLRRQASALTDGEIHLTLDTDNQWSWDNDAGQWNQLSGPGSIPDATSASGGGVKGKVTFDSDKGLSVTSGIAEVTLAASGGIKFVGGELSIEPNDFAGTGLEDDGSDNLRLATQGNGIAGGAGSTLSVDPDSESGGNIQPVSVGANGVGLDISAIAGTGLEADGSANLRLATQGNGIAGGAGSTLSVDPDSESGGDILPVSVGANGVGVDVASLAGSGLVASGAAALDINLEASNPTLQVVADELGVKLSDGLTADANGLAVNLDASGSGLEFTGAAGDGTLGVKVDGSTITINGSNQLQAIGSTEATRIENTLTTATDATTNGDPVYINGANTIGKARADTQAKTNVIGVIRTGAGAAGATPEVVSVGPCAGILSGATANAKYYLQDTGGVGTSLPSASNTIVRVGFAQNTTDLWVKIRYIGKRASV